MYITIDLGGTNTRVASSKDAKTIDKVERCSTQNDLDSQRQRISQAIHNVTKYTPEVICVGAPGLIDQNKHKFGNIVNVPSLNNMEFNQLLSDEFKTAEFFGANDAALGGLGEAVFGAGKDFNSIAYLTISTGVGGVRIAGKKLDLQQPYWEPGHHIIDVGGAVDTKVHMYGTFEAYVSGQAFQRNYGILPQNCENEEIWQDYGQKLANGLINVCAFWAPECIVIGGGLSNKFDVFIDSVKTHFSKQDFFPLPEIRKTELGDNSGIYGGLALIQQLKF